MLEIDEISMHAKRYLGILNICITYIFTNRALSLSQ